MNSVNAKIVAGGSCLITCTMKYINISYVMHYVFFIPIIDVWIDALLWLCNSPFKYHLDTRLKMYMTVLYKCYSDMYLWNVLYGIRLLKV